MLNVWYKQIMGEFTFIEKTSEGCFPIHVNICKCNGLCAFIHPYTKDNGEKFNQLIAFLADEEHMLNMLKEFNRDNPFFGEIEGVVRLNSFFPEANWIERFFTKQGYRTAEYYEPIKVERQKITIKQITL